MVAQASISSIVIRVGLAVLILARQCFLTDARSEPAAEEQRSAVLRSRRHLTLAQGLPWPHELKAGESLLSEQGDQIYYDNPRSILKMEGDCHLNFYGSDGMLVYTARSGDRGVPGQCYAKMQDDCNFVMYPSKTDSNAIWASNTGGQGPRPCRVTFQLQSDVSRPVIVVLMANDGTILWDTNHPDN